MSYYDDNYGDEKQRYYDALESWCLKKAKLFEKEVALQLESLAFLQEFCEAMAYMCIDQTVSDHYDFFEDKGFKYEDAVCYLASIKKNDSYEREVEELFNEHLRKRELAAYGL